MEKNKKEKKDYILARKDNSIGMMTRRGKQYIYFRDKKGFTGVIAKDKDTERVVKKEFGRIVKIKVKLEKGKRATTFKIKIYNKKQQRQLLFRMNENLRNKSLYKTQQRQLNLPDTKFQSDAIPMVKNKRNIDMTFDRDDIEFKPIEKIEKYQDETP
jgi:hypothetical protein